jgi:DNA-binding NarL/FixJ family response regulator
VTHLTRILIADDHPLFRGALRRAVTDVVPDCAIVEAGDFDSIRRELEGNPQMDLVLLDLAMPGVQAFRVYYICGRNIRVCPSSWFPQMMIAV